MTGNASQRARRADITFVVLSLIAGVVLLYLGRSLTFWQDEWRSITFTGSATDYLRPVNEHWSTFPLLLYRLTFEFVELRSYVPYLAEVIVLHLVAVAAAYVLMRRRVGPFAATALAVPLLFLGAGSENLFWAFQTGFVGSVMFGLWALVLIERTGRWSAVAASVLLLTSLMSSGVGLVFLVVGFGRTILDSSLRTRALAAIPPTVAYAVWYLVVGRDAVGQLASLRDLTRFIIRGVAYSTGEITGLGFSPDGRGIGLALVTALMIATGWAVIAGHPHALAAGCLLAVPVMYLLAGAVRAQLAECDCASNRRYVYVAGFLLVLSIADWLPELQARMLSLPYGWALGVGSLMLAVVVSTAANVGALGTNRVHFQYLADLTRAHIAIALTHRGESWIDPDAALPAMPRVPALLETVEKHGFPLSYSVAHGSRAYETALIGLVGDGFRVEPAVGRGQPVPITVVKADDLTAAKSGRCISLTDAGNDAGVTVSAPSGTRIRVTAASTSNGTTALSRDWPPSTYVPLELAPRSPLDVVVPNIGDGDRWRVKLVMPGRIGRVRVCGVRLD